MRDRVKKGLFLSATALCLLGPGLVLGAGGTAAPATPAPLKKTAIDEVAERYKKARTPQPGGGMLTLSPGDCKSFAKDFIKAGQKDKREADGLYNAGLVYDQCGQTKDAEDLYRQAIAKNPRQVQAINNLGVIYKNAGQIPAAEAQFEAAIKADPRQAASAYTNRAILLYETARRSGNTAGYADARETLRRALAIDAESMAAYQLLAQIYYQTAESDRSKLKLAELVCEQALKINPDYAPIYNTMGLIRLRRGEVSGALSEFRKAVTLDPGLLEAQLNIAAIGLSSRSYKQAEEAFQAVLKKQPNNLDAVIGMGVALRGDRRIDEAETWYKKAGQLDPRNCSIYYNLGLLYQDYKSTPPDLTEAQKYYNKYASCPGQDPEKLADARRRIKDIDDTFKALEEQKKLEAELKKQQEEMERQQKMMEQQQGATPPAGPAPK